MSKYSRLNENQRNHGERIALIETGNYGGRISAIEKELGIGDFRSPPSWPPSWAEFQKKADGLVILTKDDEQRLVAHQASLLPVAQKTFYSNPQNTPEKKNRRKDWSLRILNIQVECVVPDKALRKNAKDRGKNWRSIKRAAKLEITDTNESQQLPYALTIADYASRINFVLHDKIAKAQIEGNTKNVQLYNSRSDQLIAIVNEIDSSYPSTLKKLNAA